MRIPMTISIIEKYCHFSKLFGQIDIAIEKINRNNRAFEDTNLINNVLDISYL